MWTTENRAKYDRSGLRYPSDLTDAEWLLIAPLIPPAENWIGPDSRHPRDIGMAHPLGGWLGGPGASDDGCDVTLELAAYKLGTRTVVAHALIQLRELGRVLSPMTRSGVIRAFDGSRQQA